MRFVICFVVVLMAVCPAAYAVEAPAASIWYEGGTLQKATVADWQQATASNQLATSADFIASLSSVPDISAVNATVQADIKKRATDLKDCINQSIGEQADMEQDKPVSHLVVMCTIMKRTE